MYAVVGMGAVSAAGVGIEALRSAMRRGTPCIAPVTRFPTDEFTVHAAALVPGHDDPPMDRRIDGHPARLALAFALCAGQEALASAPPSPGRTALVLGTNLEDRPDPHDELLGQIAAALGVDGPRLVASLACASGTAAFGHALAILDRGEAERVLVGGVDVITPRVFAGFHRLGVLAPEAAAPFSEPAGMTLGDGAGFLVIDRGADGTCVLGVGLAADAWHPTRPAPDGRGVAAACRRALDHAGIRASEVDYVNAHGTGTEANDAPEWIGVSSVFGAVPTSSVKGLIGHAQGAAGVLEVILTLLSAEDGMLPPTWGFGEPRPGAPPDPVPAARPAPLRTFLSLNAGFGGCNAAVVLGPSRARVRRLRPIRIAGFGVVGPEEDVALPRGVDPGELDVAGRWLTAAVGLGLAELRLDRKTRARIGLVVGQRTAFARVSRELEEIVAEVGLSGVSGGLFARALVNAPAGACAAALGLRGPIDVLVAGGASGLAAVVQAAELLATRDDADHLVAATVDDRDPRCGRAGAVAVWLTAGPVGVPLVGWGYGPPAGDPGDDEAGSGGLLALVRALRASSPGVTVWSGERTLSCRVVLG